MILPITTDIVFPKNNGRLFTEKPDLESKKRMPNFELDLLENATDSLNEALNKYKQATEGDAKAYKFCVQHLSHFFELLLKYYVTRAHHLLIYKNPYAASINEDSLTINLQEAINFLKNEGREISTFEKDLKWLKKLRNNIEHHKFSMDVEETKETIGRLISAVLEFDKAHKSIDISAHIDVSKHDAFRKPTENDDPRLAKTMEVIEQAEVFRDLADTYDQRLAKAIEAVEQAEVKANEGYRPKEFMFVDFHVFHCYECDHDTMIPNEDSSTGYKCTFCGAEDSDDIETNCEICGDPWPKEMMEYTDWDDCGHGIYVCPRCRRDPEYVKDD